MKDNRPRNIDFSTINLPMTAIASITHRVSGGFLFVGIALMLYLLDLSLSSEAGFAEAASILNTPLIKLVVWAVLAALVYHFVAGIKHLLMDIGIGETFEAGNFAAKLVFVISIVISALLGVWLW